MARDARSKKRHVTDGIFAAVVRDYLVSPKFKGYSPATQDMWGRELRFAGREETLGAFSIYEIRPSLVQEFLDVMADLPGKQQVSLRALRQLESWAMVRDRLPHPITMGCEVEGPTGGHVPWTDEQVEAAEANAKEPIARLITLAVNTGQRGSDLVRMTWGDVELYKGRDGINVRQMKTGKQLWVPLTQELSAAMATWERRPGVILRNPVGNPWKRKALSAAWMWERDHNPALTEHKAAGLVIHGLRATACVRLNRAGANPRQISDMVGMSEPMVSRYLRFSVQKENASAAVLFLDGKSLKNKDRPFSRSGTKFGQGPDKAG